MDQIISNKSAAEFTRNQAVRAIARTIDAEVITGFLTHGNKHVKRYAAHKLDALVNPAPAPVLASEPETVVVAAISADQEALAKLAETYGEDREFVGQLYVDKGADLAAVKRSLISRKSARSRKAGAK